LFVAPVLVILAVTGGAYLFEREIEAILYRDAVLVEPARDTFAPGAQEAAVLAAFPGARPLRYLAAPAAGRAAEWTVTDSGGKTITAFVDPGRAVVTGLVSEDTRLMSVFRRMHGELMVGRVGDLAVELAASWTMLMLVTGLFLWWPRRQGPWGVLLPRTRAGSRTFWRDLHAVPAAWNLPLVAFLVLSGLPWSGFWGEQLARLGTIESLAPALAPTPNFGAPPDGPAHHEATSQGTATDDAIDQGLPWPVRSSTLPRAEAIATEGTIDIDDVVLLARSRGMDAPGLQVIYPGAGREVFTASFVPDRAQQQRTLHIDPASGAVLQDVGWSDYSPLGRAVEFGVMVHTGRQFGPANQWLLAVSCLVVVVSVAAGVTLWWRRRPRRLHSLPSSRAVLQGRPLPGRIVACIVALGLLLPLAGLSILALAALQYLRSLRSVSGGKA
jgi:uncharacterized iron-regulated membrane protein